MGLCGKTEFASDEALRASAEELGCNLAAAWLAYKLGITLAWAKKHYADRGFAFRNDPNVGEFWVSLALTLIKRESGYHRMDKD